MAVMASVRRTQEPTSSGNRAPGLNVVAVAMLFGAIAVGGAVSAVLRNPVPVIVTTLIGAAARAVAEDRAAVGARDRAALWPLRRPARTGAVLDRAVHRPRVVGDRSAHHRHRFCRGADAHRRHGAGQRRCGAVLDGPRCRKGRARGPGLRPRGGVGVADGAARHHRPHDAGGALERTRAGRRTSCRS